MGLLSRLFSKPETAADRAEWLGTLMRNAGESVSRMYAQSLAGARRGFEAAETPAWTESWPTTAASINADLARQLPVLRARSRSQARDNEWAVSYLIKLRDNVLGENGIVLQSRMRGPDGKSLKVINDRLEGAWEKWGRVADVSGMPWLDIEELALNSLAIDGELLYRLRPGVGPMKFQIELLPADVLDVGVNREWGGNRVIMGVELDAEGVPVAYWLKATKYGQVFSDIETVGKHLRVPADQIRHRFVRTEVGQVRGYPWLSAGARRLWLLKDFEENAAVASSNAAKRQGFFFTPDGEAPRGFVDRYVSTALEQAKLEGRELSVEEMNTLLAEAEKFATAMPGQFDTLPVGYDFRPFESKWPEVSAEGYVKQHVRGWSAARGASYVSIGNDLEAVNYSSSQVGIVAERDHYRRVQRLLRDWLHREVFEAALPWLVLSTPGLFAPAIPDYQLAATWQPRRWQGVDPVKTATADETNLRNKLTSRRRIALERGIDPDELFEEIEEEERRFGPIVQAGAAAPQSPKPSADDEDEEDDSDK